MDNEIRIFHYKYKQYQGYFWAVLTGGKLTLIEKWTSRVPIQSQEGCHLKHPDHFEGKENLPNYHLLCYGKVEFTGNTAQIVPLDLKDNP